MAKIERPTDDEVQVLANEARLFLRLVDEGQLMLIPDGDAIGVTPGYIRARLNDLESALKPFDPRGCIGDDI